MIFHSWPIVVVFLIAVSVRAQEVVNETVSFNKLNTPELFQTHLSSKLDRCDATELSVFVASDDASLSVAAGWKLAINAHSVTNGQVQNRIEQFIGIVNARVSDLPEWWTDTIRSAKFSNSGVVLFNPPRKKPLTASQNQSFSGYCSGQITKNATSVP